MTPANIAALHALVRSGSQSRAIALLKREHRDDALPFLTGRDCGRLLQVMGAVEAATSKRSGAMTIERWRAIFDDLARQAPDLAVALYTFEDEDLRRRTAAEIVAKLDAWSLLGPDTRVVDFGCGAGRLTRALAGSVLSYVGVDASHAMVEVAKSRHGDLPNVRFTTSDGRSVTACGDGVADLVLACDVFPYLVDTDQTATAAILGDFRRVLAPAGHVVILNLSYVLEPAAALRLCQDLSASAGFRIVRATTGDFQLWDAATYVLVPE